MDGYFVHFVAPSRLPPLPKHVIFVLDTSGSMIGKKMAQTQAAMDTILGEIRLGADRITIVTFSDDVKTWRHGGGDDEGEGMVVDATRENIRAAKEFVRGIEPGGER